jgi:hypothetical protein
MRVYCGWCASFLYDKEPLDDRRKTHGICQACSHHLIPKKHFGDHLAQRSARPEPS